MPVNKVGTSDPRRFSFTDKNGVEYGATVNAALSGQSEGKRFAAYMIINNQSDFVGNFKSWQDAKKAILNKLNQEGVKIDESKKNESSTASASLKGFSAPFGVSVIRKKKKQKKNVSKPYGEPELFEHAATLSTLTGLSIEQIMEVVKKSGGRYVVTNDKTGSTVGSYEKASDAWEKQRLVRKQNKNKAQKKKKPTSEKQPKAKSKADTAPKKSKTAPKAKTAPKPKTTKAKKEQFLNNLKTAFAKVLSEGNMLNYVFEQQPTATDSAVWEKFIGRLSRETVMADPKLKAILQGVAKSEAKILGAAVNEIKKCLENTGAFQVNQKGVDQNANGDVVMNFDVTLDEGSKKLGFAVKIENGRPLLLFPEDTRMNLNSMATENSKLLRAELMHVQETVLDNMHDVLLATEKRDGYLRSMSEKIDKVISGFGPLEVAMLKNLLKQKYK